MSFDTEGLYQLLPAFYRLRDSELGEQLQTLQDREKIAELKAQLSGIANQSGEEARQIARLLDEKQRGPLKALLAVIAEQAAVLEEDLAQLYDDQFIETCAEWVVPYIGDLVGTRGLFVVAGLKKLSQRAQVANTLAYRRRKGTASVLEQLARDVTGWDASVVEYFQLLATTQYMNHLRPENRSVASLRSNHFSTPLGRQSAESLAVANERQWKSWEYLNTPFDQCARTVDVRNIESRRGKYNIPNVGIFLWRLGSYSVTETPAFKVDNRRYLFDALGKDTPLYNRPETEDEITHLAEPINVPMPISRRVMDRHLDRYYGVDASGVVKSILLNVDGHEVLPADTSPPLASPPGAQLSDLIHVCDLSDLKDSGGNVIGWTHMPREKIAIDPVLGRIAFPENRLPPETVFVSYHRGFSAEMGGGEYGRAGTFSGGLEPIIKVPSQKATIQEALDQLAASGGVVEIESNDYYVQSPVITVPAGKTIELRAGDERRPILVLDGELVITGGDSAEVTLNGLLISGGHVRVPFHDSQNAVNQVRTVRLRHCTLTPGPSPAIATTGIESSPPTIEVPAQPVAPRLLVESPNTLLEIERCIVGGLRVHDQARVRIANSIVDATAEDAVAFAGTDGNAAGAPMEVQNSTIIGKVHTAMMIFASNTIFLAGMHEFDSWVAPVRAQRLQQGCVRFCYLPPGSQVPRPYHCQPESAGTAHVRPAFTSQRYGDAGYCQLSPHCVLEIRQGADDEAEMGAFHDLFQPQREANLRARLDEYLRFGLEAGILFAS